MIKQILAAVSILVMLSGCSVLGKQDFTCRAEHNENCVSTMEAYHAAVNPQQPGGKEYVTPYHHKYKKYPFPYKQNVAARTPETKMRIWIAPYTDADDVFHGQKELFVVREKAQWLFNENATFVNEE